MSQCKWHICGVGVNLDDIQFDPNRVIKCIKKMDPEVNETCLKNEYAEFCDANAFFAFQNVVEQCTHYSVIDIVLAGDNSSYLSCTSDEDDSYYLFLQPVFPWEATEQYPKSWTEARQAIISTLQVLSSMTEEEIEEVIDEELDIFCQG